MKLKALLPEHTGWELHGDHHPVINLIKNFFIPHHGNSYEPHFLRPKRLFWYGLASLSVKLVAIIFVSSLPLYAWMTPDILAEESQQIVILTNEMRSASGLSTLSQNSLLTEAARKKTDDMISGQYFAHANPDGYNMKYWLNSVGYGYLVAGENLAIGYSDAPATVSAWKASPSHYKNLIGNFTETGVTVMLGEYKGQEVALVAQYLARPTVSRAVVAEAVETKVPAPVAEVIKISTTSVPKKVAVSKSTTTIKNATPVSSTEETASSTVLSAQINNNTTTTELAPLEPLILQQTPADKYFTIKSHAIPDVSWMFSYSAWFYKLLLIFALIALSLNIIFKIKQQNIKLIGSSAMFICLMVLLIVV